MLFTSSSLIFLYRHNSLLLFQKEFQLIYWGYNLNCLWFQIIIISQSALSNTKVGLSCSPGRIPVEILCEFYPQRREHRCEWIAHDQKILLRGESTKGEKIHNKKLKTKLKFNSAVLIKKKSFMKCRTLWKMKHFLIFTILFS